jgi:hypothetical protein
MRGYAAACPDSVARDIGRRDARAPTGPSSAGPPGQIAGAAGGGARIPAGGGSGWARDIPLGPSMHQRYVDAQFDAQDARDRAAKIAEDKALRDALK